MRGSFRQTFGDNVRNKDRSMAEDEVDDEDEDVGQRMTENVEGEEEEGKEKFNEAGDQIEPFNLREERQQGYFDQNGNFVWSKEQAEPDAWLAGLDEATMEKSIGEAASARQRKEASEALIPEVVSVDKFVLKQELISLLLPEETVPAALRRLGGSGNKAMGKKQKQAASKAMSETKQTEQEKKAFDRVTDIANTLLSVGEYDIYSTVYEDLVAEIAKRKRNQSGVIHSVSSLSYSREGGVDDEDDQENGEESNGHAKYLWEYMGQDGQVHGPFTTQQLAEWRRQGFFGGESAVQMRLIQGAEEVASEQEIAVNQQDGANSPRKRVRFSEPQPDTTQDLLNDLDDDDDDNENGNGSHHAAVGKPSLAERQAYTQWHSSDAIAFERFL